MIQFRFISLNSEGFLIQQNGLDLSITLVLWKTCSAIILVGLDIASSSGYSSRRALIC